MVKIFLIEMLALCTLVIFFNFYILINKIYFIKCHYKIIKYLVN